VVSLNLAHPVVVEF